MGNNQKKSKKFLPKSLTSKVIPILTLIEKGYSKAEITKKLQLYKQLVHYYCTRLENQGYVRKVLKSSCVYYTLTQLGKNFLIECEPRGDVGLHFRLHNLVVGYPIIKDAEIGIDWKKVGMRNWVKRVGSFCGCTIERTTQKMIVYANVVEGRDPWELIYRTWRECDSVASELESRFKLVIGRGSLIRKPHFGVYDPKIRMWSKRARAYNLYWSIDSS